MAGAYLCRGTPLFRRSPARRREAACIDFDQALEAYLDGADPEELLRAAVMVLGSAMPLEPKRADIIAAVTGCTCEIADYDDAGRAVRWWFDQMAEPGTRH